MVTSSSKRQYRNALLVRTSKGFTRMHVTDEVHSLPSRDLIADSIEAVSPVIKSIQFKG